MRLVSWNCAGAFRRKRQELEHLEADLLIIQECEDPSQSDPDFLALAGNYLWQGPIKSKGIGIFATNGASLKQLDWMDSGHNTFLPFRFADCLDVLAVWTQQGNRSADAYIGQFWHYLHANKARINSNILICGDFNSNSIWDRPRSTCNHSDCVRELGELGLSSLYHHQFSERHGEETQATFYLHRNREKPYHIDYAFLNSERLEEGAARLNIGKIDNWLQHSDHLPFVIDL